MVSTVEFCSTAVFCDILKCVTCFVAKAADLTRPIEKKTYRGPSPTCHDFNQFTAKSDRLMLVVGFTLGQIQLVEPMLKEYNKLFNEEVSQFCICWFASLTLHVCS